MITVSMCVDGEKKIFGKEFDMKTEREILREAMSQEAEKQGFACTAFLPVKDLVFVPEYRKYCEQNLCGNYDKLKMCPPKSGTVEEMKERACQYETAFIMQTIQKLDVCNPDEIKRAKHRHNEMTRGVEEILKKAGVPFLTMSAGPTATSSCMSAYCVDAAKMADACGMEYWRKDGRCAFFSEILF